MPKLYRIRRGNKDNVLNVKYTYTVLLDILEMYYLGKEDKITLKSHDDEYQQTLILGKEGKIVDERWVKITFTQVKPKKLYACLIDPKTIASYDFDAYPEKKISQRELIEKKNRTSGQKGEGKNDSKESSNGPLQNMNTSNHAQYVVFNKVPLDVKDFNKINTFEESPLDEIIKMLESPAEDSIPNEFQNALSDMDTNLLMTEIENLPLDGSIGLAYLADMPEDKDFEDNEEYEIDSEDLLEFTDTDKTEPYKEKYLDEEEKLFKKKLQVRKKD